MGRKKRTNTIRAKANAPAPEVQPEEKVEDTTGTDPALEEAKAPQETLGGDNVGTPDSDKLKPVDENQIEEAGQAEAEKETEEVVTEETPDEPKENDDETSDAPEADKVEDAKEEDVKEDGPGAIPASLPWLGAYEDRARGNIMIEADEMENVQMVMYRGLTSILAEGKGNRKRFTDFLNRMDARPDVYDSSLLLRRIAEMTPQKVPSWYFPLLHLLTKAVDPVERTQLSGSVDMAGLLAGIPEKHYTFLIQYFESISIK